LYKNWLEYYNSSNIITGKITGTNKINSLYLNDLLGMLTGVRSIEYRLHGLAFFKQHSVNKIAFIVLREEFKAVGSRS